MQRRSLVIWCVRAVAMSLTDDLLARCVFPVGADEVTVAVSGGPDSSALLILAIASGRRVTAIHVDHGLRPGSAAEAQVVAATAERFGATFRAERVVVEPGPNLEARARTARYGVLPDDVLTGHTLDDRAETILLHLLRGAGSDGIAALDGSDGRRPLLGLRRAETVALCEESQVAVVTDPSNADPAFRRNRVRHELLPLLDEIAGRDVAPLLVRTGALVAQDVSYLEELSEAVDPTDTRMLASVPPVLASRALRRWLTITHDGFVPSAAELERVMAVVRGESVACELAGGWRVARRDRRLRLEAPPAHP